MNNQNVINTPVGDPRNKLMILIIVGIITFLISFGVWIWRLIDLSQKEKNKNFKNSLWLTFLMPLGFAIPSLYMMSLSALAGFLGNASWWVYPTVIFTAIDFAFLGPGIIGGFLTGKEEGEETPSPKERESQESTFYCSTCHIKYSQDMFGAETVKEGKICRPCLARKQQGGK